MASFTRTLFLSLFVIVISVIAFPNVSYAEISVDDRQLVSKRRRGRTVFEYTYKLQVTTTGPGVDKATVYVVCESPGLVMLDDKVVIEPLPADETIVSDDTFKFRLDRRNPLNPECFDYVIGIDTTLVLSGVVTDTVFGNAPVRIIVDGTEAGRPIIEAGRPIIETYEGMTDENGSYEVTAEVVSPDDFITVESDGAAGSEQEGAQLTSTLGSVGGLQSGASPGSFMVGGEDVTHITTANAILAAQAAETAGEEILDDETLAAFEAQVPGEDLVNLAAAIKTVVDDPDIPIPDDGDGFLETIAENPEVTEMFITETMEENPEEFMAALEETVEDLPLEYDQDDLEDTQLYTNLVTNNPLQTSASAYEFGAVGTGKVYRFEGASDMDDWFVDGDGVLVIVPESLVQTFVIFCDAGQGQEPFEQQTIIDEIRLKRVVAGVASDQVFQYATITRTAIPDCGIDEETTVGEPDPANTFLAVNDSQIIPVDPVDLVDGPFVNEQLHSDNNNSGANDSRFGADFFTFNPDGTGSTQRTGYGFSWSIDAAGRLDVTYDNGDFNQYVVIAEDDGPITRTVLIADLTDDTKGPPEKATSGLAVDPDGMSEFDDGVLSDHRFRSLFTIVDPELFGPTFDFLFEDGGTGCRVFDTFFNPFEWEVVDSRVEITRFFIFDPSIILRVRTWEGAATVIGTLGNRIWLIENFNFNFDAEPGFDPTPESEVGRINAYEDLGVFTGNLPPVTVDNNESTSVNTAITFDPSSNDTDPEDDSIVIIMNDTTSDNGGTIVANFNAEGTQIVDLTYTPPLDFEDQDRFSYQVSDLQNCTLVEGEVFIDVTP